MSDFTAFAAELRTLAKPHALVRRADVRRDALLDLARRLEQAQPVERASAVLMDVSTAERRRWRRSEKSDPWAELRRVLNDETAEL